MIKVIGAVTGQETYINGPIKNATLEKADRFILQHDAECVVRREQEKLNQYRGWVGSLTPTFQIVEVEK